MTKNMSPGTKNLCPWTDLTRGKEIEEGEEEEGRGDKGEEGKCQGRYPVGPTTKIAIKLP